MGKPYLVTEWGVNGPFEAPRTAWGAKKEPPGGIKASTRLRRYEEIISADSSMCLGSYCFLWGQKQESTATWHGLFLSDGRPTDGVDAMHKAWHGDWPEKRAPSIQNVHLNDLDWKQDHVLRPRTEAKIEIELDDWGGDFAAMRPFPESTSKNPGEIIKKACEKFQLIFHLLRIIISHFLPQKNRGRTGSSSQFIETK